MDNGPTPHSDLVENLVFRFETAWQEGETPRITDFLPERKDDRWGVLVELVHVDLEFRVKSDNHIRVERYFDQFPEWADHADDAVELIAAEYNFRARDDSPPSLDEYRGRFPRLWDRLLDRLTATFRAAGETLQGSRSQLDNDGEQTQIYGATGDPAVASTGNRGGFRYRIISNHASGGLGDVFLAHDSEVSREVALKQLKSQFADDPDSQARFLREAEITGGLEHPGIVPVYGMGAYGDGRPYYAMRFVRGGSFKAAIERYHEIVGVRELESLRTLKLRKLLARFIEVCHAIDYAHSRGVVHRDIKPANIMLGKYGETLVVDWGLAKPIGRGTTSRSTDEVTLRPQSGSGSSATQMGSAVGTPAYMSPEQAAGQVDSLGPATDVFSLGATLYHLLTGQSPQTSLEVPVVIGRVTRGEFQLPSEVCGDVPAGLEAICLKAMALRPEDRYRTAGAIAADIENWLADEPVAAHREPWQDRARRWMRRHRSFVSSGVVAGVLLITTAVAGLFAWEHARQEARFRRDQVQTAVLTADESAIAELRGDRFSAAVAILDTALEQLKSQPQLTDLRSRIEHRREHVQQLVDFYRLAEQAEELAIFENDAAATIASQSALDALKIFDYADWWEHLPDEELSAQQADRLRQAVYDQLLLLALFKGKSILLNILSPTSVEESRQLLDIAELAQSFRRAESITALQACANMRLGRGLVFPDIMNLRPKSAADNNAVGIMIWSMSQNPVMRNLVLAGRSFDGDLMEVARGFLVRAAALDPDRYLTMFTLGFVCRQLGDYAAAQQAFNQCIVLRPDDCLAYCIRAETYLAEAADTGNQQRKTALLHEALVDAEKARDLAPMTHYVHWYRGLVLRDMEQAPEAVTAFIEAVRLGKPAVRDLSRVLNKNRESVEETRAYANQLLEIEPDNTDYRMLLATAEWSLGNDPAAAVAAESVLAKQPNRAAAQAIRGTAAIHSGNRIAAISDFRAALDNDPENYEAAMGLSRSLVITKEYPAALAAFDRGISIAKTDWQTAEAQLGRSEVLMRMTRFSAAAHALRAAVARDPSCNYEKVAKLAAEYKATAVTEIIDSRRASKFGEKSSRRHFPVLPLLNGGFELGLSAYWGQAEAGKPIWWNRGGCRSLAEVSGDDRHSGELSLHIQHTSPAADGVIAETSQTVPAIPDARYQISLWAKADGLAVNGAYVVIGSAANVPHVALPAGTYDWQQVTGEFTAKGDQVRLRIISRDVGDVWLDDIRIELAEK
ncbi:Serine/threonine-protein kinase PknD [Symmachiella dynata]|uniref:protein kinase domain-containing protein n=1 Tax=Symmachiella dynata TaxID=2527995 RepID=UPI001188E8E7|nr:protein kinase [Symmachiella dynata]QDT48977.1 Serine/threonine-protein kinase PknD [Symmachiella dynata]